MRASRSRCRARAARRAATRMPDRRARARRCAIDRRPPRALRARVRLHAARRAARDVPARARLPAAHGAAGATAPFSAVGVVHIANRIVQHRPLLLGEELVAAASRCPSCAPHRARARRSTSSARRFVGDELVWEDVSTNLKRGDGDESLPREPAFEEPPGAPRTGACPDDLGRRYAAVSGDHNPIHLHALQREGVRLPARDRARHVDQGALPGRAAAARTLHGRRALHASRSCCPRR